MQYLEEQLVGQDTVYEGRIIIGFPTRTSERRYGSNIDSIKIWNINPENNKELQK